MGLKTPGILRLQSLPEGRSPLMLKGLLVLRQRLTRVCMAFWASVSLAELKFLSSCFWLTSEWHWWRAKAGAPQPFLFLENGTFWLLLECPLLILFLSWNSPYLGFSKRLRENRRRVKAVSVTASSILRKCEPGFQVSRPDIIRTGSITFQVLLQRTSSKVREDSGGQKFSTKKGQWGGLSISSLSVWPHHLLLNISSWHWKDRHGKQILNILNICRAADIC